MKKTILFAVLITMMTAVCSCGGKGDVKVQAKYQKGDTVVYTTIVNTQLDSNDSNNVSTDTIESRWVVKDATANGYLIEMQTTKYATNLDINDMQNRMKTLVQMFTKRTPVVFKTDLDGKVTGIANIQEVQQSILNMADTLIGELYANISDSVSNVEKILPKENIINMMKNFVNEETLVNSATFGPAPFALNGKNIKNGGSDVSKVMNLMKVKNVYTILNETPLKVKADITLDMSKEDMKQMMLEQMKKLMPEQAEGMEKQIDAMIESGMMKIDITGNIEYVFAPDTWLESCTSTLNTNTNGQNIAVKSILRRTYSNRK